MFPSKQNSKSTIESANSKSMIESFWSLDLRGDNAEITNGRNDYTEGLVPLDEARREFVHCLSDIREIQIDQSMKCSCLR
jgi:hypothetical protein